MIAGGGPVLRQSVRRKSLADEAVLASQPHGTMQQVVVANGSVPAARIVQNSTLHLCLGQES